MISERDDIKALRIKITGRVQGIGFRPFVYRLATQLGLHGWIYNDPDGVVIHVEGNDPTLKTFVTSLTKEAPALSHFNSFETLNVVPQHLVRFSIRESAGSDD